MAVGLILIGAVLIIAAIRNTQGQLGEALVQDFTGKNSFLVWLAAISVIGFIGYIPGLQTPSRMLIALVLIVFLIANKGAFSGFVSAVENAQQNQTKAPELEKFQGPLPISLLGGSGSGGGAAGVAKTAASAIPFIGGLFG